MQKLFTHNPARGKDRFLQPNVKGVTYGEKSLRSFGPIIWNQMLPESLKTCVSLESFKESIKGWVPTNCKCGLCRDYIGGVGYVNITEWKEIKGQKPSKLCQVILNFELQQFICCFSMRVCPCFLSRTWYIYPYSIPEMYPISTRGL